MTRTRRQNNQTAPPKLSRANSSAHKAIAAPPLDSQIALASRYMVPTGLPPRPICLLILPLDAVDGRQVVLPHPRTSNATRFLASPQSGRFYELTRVSAPHSSPRSWLLTPKTRSLAFGVPTTQITSSADLFIATPFDPVFFLLPALAGAADATAAQRRHFLSVDDHLDALDENTTASDLGHILRWNSIRSVLERRLADVCDSVSAGDDDMYRLSEDKLLRLLVAKARAVSAIRLPESMEEQFVNRTLIAPIAPISTARRGGGPPATGIIKPGVSPLSSSITPALSPQHVLHGSTVGSMPGEVEEEEVEISATMCADAEVVSQQRILVAFDFICGRYLPTALAARLQARLMDVSVSPVNLFRLNGYLERVGQARVEAAAVARIAGDGRKHALDEDATGEGREARRRRVAEEEKKRLAGESRGLRELKKVNTAGMRKMSDFFGKQQKERKG